MSNTSKKLDDIIKLVYARAAASEASGTSDVSPSKSRGQKDRLRVAVTTHFVSLEEMNHVFQDITSASSLRYFDEDDAALIRQAASGLSDARRAIRRLASRRWVQK